MNIEVFKEKVSMYANKRIPFILIIDFELHNPFVCKLDEANIHGIYYDIKGNTNFKYLNTNYKIELNSFPLQKHIYSEKFFKIINHLHNGDTYLLNLTFPTKIDINLTLEEIFNIANAPYKLLFYENFVVFSPECFVKINNNEIFTYPMKGTIDARLDNAEILLLNNKKEGWEHNTIVDLLRNDISIIANNISINKLRYVEKIITHKNEILQTSSEIKGELPINWQNDFANILLKLLPAGSISGSPKQKTLEIIRNVEIDKRGYYTGIFGIFDGENFDSAVLIRYIEKKHNDYYFRSGGGITANSNMEDEYLELINKIYVPTF